MHENPYQPNNIIERGVENQRGTQSYKSSPINSQTTFKRILIVQLGGDQSFQAIVLTEAIQQ